MSEEKNMLEKLNEAFAEFKTANDARLAEIEKKGSADTVLEEKTDKINAEITKLQSQLAEVEKKAGRPSAAEARDEEAEEHKTAFMNWVRKGREAELDAIEAKSMSVTGNSGNDGGHTVPVIVDTNINNQLKTLSAMRRLARIDTVVSGNHSVLLNDRGFASGWVDENDARTETASASITKLAVNMGEVYANVAVTQQLLDDAAFNLEGFLADELAAEFAEAEGAAFISGDGTNKPAGLILGGSTQINSGHASALTYGGLVNLVYGLKNGYRANAAFIMNAATLAEVRKLGTADNGLWAPSMAAGQPSTLLGHAVYEDENMPAIAAGAEPIAFGDFKRGYIIADRIGIRTLRDPYSNKPYVMFYATKRVGGRVLDPAAIKLQTIAA